MIMVIIVLIVTCPYAMLYSLDSELRVHFWNTNAFDVVDELKGADYIASQKNKV